MSTLPYSRNCGRCKVKFTSGLDLKRCPLHSKPLYVMSSTIKNAGDGVFAKEQPGVQIFKCGDVVTYHIGEGLTETQYNKRYPDGDSEYVMKITRSRRAFDVDKSLRYIDAAFYRSSGAMINHSIKKNCRLTDYCVKVYHDDFHQPGQFPLLQSPIIATKPIFHGDELFLNYGSSYCIDNPDQID